MFELRISSRAQKQIKTIKRKYQQSILDALDEIKEYPNVGKPLSRELTGRFSLKIGVYRIIYKVDNRDKIVTVFTVGHRSTAYK